MSVRNHKAQKYSPKKRKQLMNDFLVAFEKTLGVVSPAADMIGVRRSTIYRWREQYPEFDEACREISETAIDFVETKMFKKIDRSDKGSESLMIFYLKTKGKHRGYVERQEVDMDANVQGVTVNVTNPETKQILQEILDKDKQQ